MKLIKKLLILGIAFSIFSGVTMAFMDDFTKGCVSLFFACALTFLIIKVDEVS